MVRGTITRAFDDRGFCFILEDRGPEMFANRREFSNTQLSFRDIAGARVEFSIAETPRGFQARAVKIIDDPAGRNYGTIARLIRSGGGFIEGYGAPDRGIFFSEVELVGTFPDDLVGVNVSYTTKTDDKGRLTAVAIRKISTQGTA